jgi:hypothetical protein
VPSKRGEAKKKRKARAKIGETVEGKNREVGGAETKFQFHDKNKSGMEEKKT